MCVCVCTPGCTVCVRAKQVQGGLKQGGWRDRGCSQSLSRNTLSKDSFQGHPDTRRQVDRQTGSHTHTETHTYSDTERRRHTHTNTVLYSFTRRLVRCSHKRRQRRGSGKQSLLHSWVLETGGTARHTGLRGETPWWPGSRSEGSPQSMEFLGVSVETTRQDRVSSLGLASLNSFTGL